MKILDYNCKFDYNSITLYIRITPGCHALHHALKIDFPSIHSCIKMLNYLGLYIFLLVAYTDANDVTWFIGGPDHLNSSANITECGRTVQLPCINLSVVLEVSKVFEINGSRCALSTNEGNRSSTTVIFLSGTHVLPAICLYNWSNVYVQGEGNVSIVSPRSGQIGEYGLFKFVNISNITIVNLNFVVYTTGRAALLFQNSIGVFILNCMYDLPAERSRGIIIEQPQGDVVIQGCVFRGNILNVTESAGLIIYYDEGVSAVKIEHCDFRDFYVDPMTQQESYRHARRTGQALVLLFDEFSTGHTVEVSQCLFTENFAYSGSTLLISFYSGSKLNSVLVAGCRFIGNRNLYGAVGIYHWRRTADNSVTIKHSNFSGNLANLEGGGIFAAFLSRHATNLLTIHNCVFVNNSANEGAAIDLFNSPAWFTHSVDVSNELVSVNISDCTFANNVALGTEGVINALRIRLFFSNTK